MVILSRRQMLRLFDTERIKQAIEEAEARTSGEICVSLAPFFWGNVHRAAEKAFVRMGMTRTRERNGILFFIVPARHKFTILGDSGIHAKVGQEFWEHITALVAEKFRARDFTGGVVAGIDEAGRQLAQHFPRDHARDVNELSDEIDFGGKKRDKDKQS